MGSQLSESFDCKTDWRDKDWDTKTDRKMRQHDKREEAKREVKRLRENLDTMLKSENINPVAINRIGELQAKANQVYEAANDKYNESMLEEGHLRTRKSGKAVEMEIQSRIKEFIETGRDDVKKRQEFSLWFSDTGLAISLDLRTGAFEIGIGKVEKNVLEELDMALEDLASLITDKEQFEKAKTIREKEMAVA